MTELIDTIEMYLRTILELEEDGVTPLRARIAERLGHSNPTVSQTVNRMQRDGLVSLSDEDRHLELSVLGRKKAIEVMRKHRLAERLLADVIKLDWEYVHEEACRWEHVMSEKVEQKIINILDNPTYSPYGNIIPGLDVFGIFVDSEENQEIKNIYEVLNNSDNKDNKYEVGCTVKRLGEPAQLDPELLNDFKNHGIVPGARVFCSIDGKYIRMKSDNYDQALEVNLDIAQHIFVILN